MCADKRFPHLFVFLFFLWVLSGVFFLNCVNLSHAVHIVLKINKMLLNPNQPTILWLLIHADYLFHIFVFVWILRYFYMDGASSK